MTIDVDTLAVTSHGLVPLTIHNVLTSLACVGVALIVF